MDEIELDYDFLTYRALKRVVRDVLELTMEHGAAPGNHHFYIEFATQAPGVQMPADLLATYKSRMTIVLQHQFRDLLVDEDGFSVTLFFKGKPAHLVVPFDAVTSFADPSVQFGLRFAEVSDEPDDGAKPAPSASLSEMAPGEARKAGAAPMPGPEGAAVVSLDQFRKK